MNVLFIIIMNINGVIGKNLIMMYCIEFLVLRDGVGVAAEHTMMQSL